MTRFLPLLALVGLAVSAGSLRGEPAPAGHVTTIMPLGDSITEGGGGFVVYRRALLDKLTAAGYHVQYVGSKQRPSSAADREPLAHEGYSGQNIGYLAQKFEALYRQNPADILLLHSGHNHSVEQKPVEGMLKNTRAIILKAREINPKVTVLVAQVILSGKLPKYEYLPEFNQGIAKLAAELDTPSQRVLAVNMADGFDWQTDTIGDHVHPNASGAEKMAAHWFAALQTVLTK